jgi:adhesin transport system outer membrane protein
MAATLMLLAGAAMAQTPSFETIVRQALATHPSIQAKRSTAGAAKADLDGAVWQRYPTPSVEVNSDSNGARTTLLRIQQPLWSGGRIDASIDAAASRHQAADEAIQEARQDIVQRVIGSHVEALRQQRNVATLEQGVHQNEELLGLISRRVEREASAQVDQELAESRLYQSENELSAARLALANALTQLSQLCGMPVDHVDAMEGDSAAGQLSRESLLEQAMAWSPLLRRLSFEQAAAQADIETKRASYKPQVSLRFENSNSTDALNGISAYNTNRLMVVLEAQTGAGLSAFSGVEAAMARQEAVQQQRESAIRDLQERINIDWSEWRTARLRLENATRASKSAKKVYESYSRQFTAGKKGWFEVLNMVRESTQSDTASTDAAAQMTGAVMRLKLVCGNLKGLFE